MSYLLKVIVYREYIYMDSDSDWWAPAPNTRRPVWVDGSAVEHQGPLGFHEGMLYCEVDDKPVSIEQFEAFVGRPRKDIDNEIIAARKS